MADTYNEKDPYAGIFAALSGANVNPSLASIGEALKLRRRLRAASPGGGQIPLDQTRKLIPQLSALPGLAPTDYAGQLGEAGQMAKLQLGLALATRGFGAMGAQPRAGEMPISTLGREMLAPLGADAMTVAQQLYDQKLKLKAAEKAQQAALSQAALSLATAQQEGELGFVDKAITAEMGRARIAPKTAAVKDVQFKVTQDGKEIWRDTPAISVYNAATGNLEYRGPGNVLLEFDPKKDGYNARLLSSGETGSPYQPSKTEQIVINKPLQEFMKTHYDIDIPDTSLGTETTMETYLPKGGFEDKPRYNVLNIAGTQYDTRMDKDGEAIPPQALADAITLWADPTAPRAPTIESPESKQNFAGFMAGLGGMQRNMNLGNTALRFVPGNRNFELDPDAALFPFERVDNQPLTRQEKINVATDLRTGHLRLADRIKAGETRADLDKDYAQEILGRYRSIEDWGLSPIDQAADVEIPREQITQPAAIAARYKAAAPFFQTDRVAANTIRNLPLPVGENLRAGTGRVVLYDKLGVNFGEATTSPPSYTGEPETITLEDRQNQIASLDRSDVQKRILAERLSKGTSLSTVLSPALTDTLDEQLRAISTALDTDEEALSEILADDSNRQLIEDLGVQLNAIQTIDKAGVLANRSGVQGFLFGPAEAGLFKNFGWEPGSWFRDDAGQEAARELIALMPVLQELSGRQYLEMVGEDRKSNADLRGMQKVLPKLGQAEDYNAEKLRQLRSFLVGNVQAQLNTLGTYAPPDALLVQAAAQGFDLKAIKGQNNYYNPYLADSNYAVTKQPVPTYSREVQQEIRNQGILNYVATGLPGQAIQYELLTVDDKGLPIWDKATKRYLTGLYNADALKLPINKKTVDFNVNRLRNQFKIDN